MQITNDAANAYAKKFTTPLRGIEAQNEKDTLGNHPHAHMHSGHVQGRVLEALSRMLKPRRILEIGTFTGFSALCLSRGLANGGILHTIELREDDALHAKTYFEQSDMPASIILHTGNALSIIPRLHEEWDMVFIDADKVNYIDYYELTLNTLKPGGWIIADNVLFHGEVLNDVISGKNAKAIHAFNEHVLADHRVEQVLLTVRDGLMLIRKL